MHLGIGSSELSCTGSEQTGITAQAVMLIDLLHLVLHVVLLCLLIF